MDRLTTDPQQHPSTPRNYRRYLLQAVLLLLPLLILAGIIAGRAPRSLRVVGTYPMVSKPYLGGTLNPHTTGFFTQPDAHTYALRDWDGVLRWRVTPVAFPISPAVTVNPVRDIACSPDGRFFACATVLGPTLLVEIWREGTPIGRHTLPLSPKVVLERLIVQSTNAGRIVLRFKYSPKITAEMIVLQGQSVLARGAGTGRWITRTGWRHLCHARTAWFLLCQGRAT